MASKFEALVQRQAAKASLRKLDALAYDPIPRDTQDQRLLDGVWISNLDPKRTVSIPEAKAVGGKVKLAKSLVPVVSEKTVRRRARLYSAWVRQSVDPANNLIPPRASYTCGGCGRASRNCECSRYCPVHSNILRSRCKCYAD